VELTSFAELNVTRKKLQMLEELFAKEERTPTDNPFVKELSQRSLKRMIHQLKEEIARFEARANLPDQAKPSSIPETSSHTSDRG